MVKIGKIVNTHKLNGEVRVLSNSDFKDIRFVVGAVILVEDKKLIIEKYYTHKTFDILKFVGLDKIEDVLKFKNKDIFAEEIKDEDMLENEFLNKDLIGLRLYNNDVDYGEVIDVVENPAHNLLRVKYNEQTFLLPFNDYFIIDVKLDEKKIYFNLIEGLIDED